MSLGEISSGHRYIDRFAIRKLKVDFMHRASSRRAFLRQIAGTACAATAAAILPKQTAATLPPLEGGDVVIRRAMMCRFVYDRPRWIAGNARYRVAGLTRNEDILLLFGNNDQIGVGGCRRGVTLEHARFLLGKSLTELLGNQVDEVNRRTGTSAIWDLAGKSAGKPVYELLGGTVPAAGVGVYDGTIYHEELLGRDTGSAYRNPDSALGENPDWSDIIKEGVDASLTMGHTFLKVKIGRGAKHLSRRAGNYQDAAVVRLIRKHLGPDIGIGVDANNGYGFEDAIWFLEECGNLDLAFIEEMFPEAVEPYERVRQHLRQAGLKTLIADGETWKSPRDAVARQIIDSGAVDILQGDIRRFQIEGILEESRMALAARHGAKIAPHNWGSDIGFCMQIHLACAMPNFYLAEHDPATARDELLVKQGYSIKHGHCFDFDAPGFGIEVNRKRLDKLDVQFEAAL